MNSFWFRVFLFLSLSIILAFYQWWAAAAAVSLLLSAAIFFYPDKRREAVLFLLLIILGMGYFQLRHIEKPDVYEVSENTVLQGEILTIPRHSEDRTRFILLCENEDPARQKIQVFCNFDSNIQQGETIRIEAGYEPPARPGNPGEFDYPAYLSYQNIFYIASVDKPEKMTVIAPASGVRKWMNSYRQVIEEVFRKSLPLDEANILLGMLLGNIDGIEAAEYSNYQKSGLVHIFSVSGMHIAFLLLMITWICSLLKLSKRNRFIVVLVIFLLYGWLIGWPVPVMRSVFMGLLPLLAHYLGRNNDMLNSLGLSGLFILLINPQSLMQISFQLSFLGTWALVYLYPLLKKYPIFGSTDSIVINKYLKDLILIPFCAQLSVLPLIAYNFNIFSPISIISNLLLSYVSGAIVILGFIALIFAPVVSAISSLILFAGGWLIEIMRAVTRLLLYVPGAYFWVATPGILLIIAYYAGLLLGCNCLEGKRAFAWRNNPKLKITLLLWAVFFTGIFWPAAWVDKGLAEAVFVDVGQGDCTLLKSPQGKFVLIDGGGSEYSAVGQRKLLPYLRHRGINELYMIINTHPDADHLRGLEEILPEVKVRYAAIPAVLSHAPAYENFFRLLKESRTQLILLSAKQVVNIENNWNLEVVYAGQPGENSDDYNENSAVIRSSFGLFSLIITGDVGTETLETIVEDKNPPSSLIVKVPHHGSRNSYTENFYRRIKPKYAVISSGLNNLYGHPH
ncbi:MAG: DNA internalization-related competence protein ComEC/Rec2, partial [Syntrophomonadaceae bacterium]|nr:DNA internalization-related competence protein ComEC/Rec2 [Syntrophomonadaceae bacterium]